MKKITFLLFAVVFIMNNLFSQNSQVSENEINQIVQKAYEKLNPVGLSVAVIKDNQTYFFSYGYRNNDLKTEVSHQSLYNIASCTKAFTAAAIGMLVEEGKISWDDKVVTYIPEFRLKVPYASREMNITDLLSHRSGLTTFTGDLLWYHTNYSNEEVIERMRYLPVENDFREDYGYQNNMYMVAGEIIERVSGMSWSQFMEERIFKPLQMNQTLPSNDELTESMEIAYPHLNGEKVTMYDFHATKAAASIHSNITDLSKWVRMLLEYGIYEEEKLMEESTVRHLYTPQIVRGVSKSMEKQGINFRAYALGWSVHDFHGKKVIEHNGGMPGYISKVTLVPQENLGFVVLNNGFEFFVHNALKNEILQYFITKDEQDWISMAAEQKEKYLSYQAEEKEKRLNHRIEGTNPSLPLSSYKGKYVDRMYGEAIIEMDGDKAILTLLPTKDHFFSEMKHWHYDTFRVDFKDPFLPFGLVTFDFNEKGNPIGFKIDLPINDFHFHNLYFQKTE